MRTYTGLLLFAVGTMCASLVCVEVVMTLLNRALVLALYEEGVCYPVPPQLGTAFLPYAHVNHMGIVYVNFASPGFNRFVWTRCYVGSDDASMWPPWVVSWVALFTGSAFLWVSKRMGEW